MKKKIRDDGYITVFKQVYPKIRHQIEEKCRNRVAKMGAILPSTNTRSNPTLPIAKQLRPSPASQIKPQGKKILLPRREKKNIVVPALPVPPRILPSMQ